MPRPYYQDYARHMWRYYCAHPDVKLSDNITRVNLNNWFACSRVYQRMTDAERDIIQTYATCPSGTEITTMDDYVTTHNLRSGDVWYVIRQAIKNAAVERGLYVEQEWKTVDTT